MPPTDPNNTQTNPDAVPIEDGGRWALGHVPSHMRLWIVAILGLVADLWTKAWAFQAFDAEESRVLIKNVCNLQLSLNPGALFGVGAGMAPIFVGASVLALLFVLYLFANSGIRRWSMHIGLGMVLAGAMGNLYDRTTQEAYVAYFPQGGRVIGILDKEAESGVYVGRFPDGRNSQFYRGRPDPARSGVQPVVRDFIKIELKIGRFTLWPWIFNIADALLVIGVFMLLLNFWFDRKHHSTPAGRTRAEGRVVG